MSYRMEKKDVLFTQRLFKVDGLYLGGLDGIWGKLTEEASNKYDEYFNKLKNEIGRFDERSEKNIYGLTLSAQKEARLFLERASETLYKVKIISGTRTYEEQNRLYKIGRFGNPGDIVTYARGGYSNHNFGIAWDVGIFYNNGGYSQDSEEYVNLAKLVKNGLEWGGDWKKFFDPPHYQLKTVNKSISWIRKHFESGSGFKEMVYV